MANKKARGTRAKTRAKFARKSKQRATVNKLVQDFVVGERVKVIIDSSIHSGLPNKRYQGSTGVVLGKQGRLFNVKVRKGSLIRQLLVSAAHLVGEKFG